MPLPVLDEVIRGMLDKCKSRTTFSMEPFRVGTPSNAVTTGPKTFLRFGGLLKSSGHWPQFSFIEQKWHIKRFSCLFHNTYTIWCGVKDWVSFMRKKGQNRTRTAPEWGYPHGVRATEVRNTPKSESEWKGKPSRPSQQWYPHEVPTTFMVYKTCSRR